MIRLVLRTTAVFIAIASIVDPAWSIDRPEPEELVVIDLAQGDVAGSVAALQGALPGWRVERREGSARAVPCAPDEQCVIAADGSIDPVFPGDLRKPASMIAIRRDGEPNVAITSAIAGSAQAAAAGIVRVTLERAGTIPETTVLVHDGAAVVGSVVHKWGSGTTAAVDVPWWPLDEGARALRVEATPAEAEANTIDNVLDLGVQVGPARARVLVLDARPSWNSTFVRRALEDDPRVSVEHRARVAPALTAGTRSAVLDSNALDVTPVVIVGDPDALTAGDVALLERFVRVRGGSLVLLPERRITGPAAQLLAGDWTEHLLPSAERVGVLHASELLRAGDLPVGSTVLAYSGNAPSIVSMPLGYGRVIVSGAMDAWRYRDRDQGSGIGDQGAFDRFWTSLVLEAAAAGEALRIEPEAALASAGARVSFTVRMRSFEVGDSSEVTVTARCGDTPPTPVRVWPTGAMHEFTGELAVVEDRCELEAIAGDRVARSWIAVSPAPHRGVAATLTKLERAIAANGGTAIAVGDEAALATNLAANFTTTSRIVSVHPMRAWWWMIPFAGCLAAEWWLRRRDGLR